MGLRESLRLSFADALRGLVQHNRSSSSEDQNSRNTASMPIDNKLQHQPFPQLLSQKFWRCNRSSSEEVSSQNLRHNGVGFTIAGS